jgi:tetratricopeptide (TPR) repeat protein
MAALLLTIALARVAGAGVPEESYAAANQAYFDGHHEEAAGLYEPLLKTAGGAAAAIAFNLGNCAYQREQYGKAVYYYRQAMAGRDDETSAKASGNLEKARRALFEKHKKRIEKGIVRYDESHGVWHAIFTLIPTGVSLGLFLLFSGLLFGAMFAWAFARGQTVVSAARTVFLSVLAPALAAGGFYFGRTAVEQTHQFGIVVSDTALLHDAPDEDAPGTSLAEGLEVRILLRNESGFYKLEMSDGKTGYADEADVWRLGEAGG